MSKKLYYDQNESVEPDFFLTEHDIFVDFWGMVDVEDEEVAKSINHTRSGRNGCTSGWIRS
ncbi:MAG: hypothetical protein ACW99Q_10745 [Candidatus Kariarchaeaceae archaeon]|jgi:hypothetical protein